MTSEANKKVFLNNPYNARNISSKFHQSSILSSKDIEELSLTFFT